MEPRPILSMPAHAFVAAARRAVLATTDPAGRPRLVPICFVLADPEGSDVPVLYSPLDEKRKATADPRRLARVRDLIARPAVTVLVDRWDEDWSRLGWVRLSGRAGLLEPSGDDRAEHTMAVALLRAKHRQYVDHRLEDRPMVRIAVDASSAWGNLDPD